jgi:hypothetical protein
VPGLQVWTTKPSSHCYHYFWYSHCHIFDQLLPIGECFLHDFIFTDSLCSFWYEISKPPSGFSVPVWKSAIFQKSLSWFFVVVVFTFFETGSHYVSRLASNSLCNQAGSNSESLCLAHKCCDHSVHHHAWFNMPFFPRPQYWGLNPGPWIC